MKIRNIFAISSKLQRKYLRLIVLSLLIPTLFVGGCLYYLVFTLVAEEIAIPEFIAFILFPVFKRVNIVLAIGIPAIFLLLYWWGLILSHRMAGPIERLKKELDRVLKGDYSHRISVRKHDELKPFVDDINKILEKLEEKKD